MIYFVINLYRKDCKFLVNIADFTVEKNYLFYDEENYSNKEEFKFKKFFS